ncbi:MAG TPA: outer membrane protein assembly factor BamD [Gemmatimonadales bacterium]|nr:outer membrane protein assembly factor BamD [Gemmatimonadales bacterium]
MTRLHLAAFAALVTAACGPAVNSRGGPAQPAPVQLASASAGQVDTLWQKADQLFRHGKWGDAQAAFERLNLEFAPGDPRIARARFELAECYLEGKSHLQAVREFRRVSDDLPGDELAPEALLRAGDAYAELWRRPELDPTYAQTAIQTYHELQTRYPGTAAARRSFGRVKGIEDLLAFKQYESAMYYVKYKAYDSAIIYFKDLAATYPRAPITPTALVQLVGIYRILGYQEDVNDTCGYLGRTTPSAPGVSEACAGPSAPPTPAAPGAHG